MIDRLLLKKEKKQRIAAQWQAIFACDVSVNLSQRKGSLMDRTIP